MIIAMAALLALYLLLTASLEEFRSIKNLIAFLVLELILLFAFKVSGYFASGRSAFIGLIVLGALIVISAFSIEGFLSAPNVRAILLFAAFLGIASVGQTMVALLGGLDLSIPFVIGAANIALLSLITAGVPSYVAFGFILTLGGVVGLINGLMSFKLQGQALIVTLRHWVRDRWLYSDHDVYRLKICRECLWRCSRLVKQSCCHEWPVLWHEVSTYHYHLDCHCDCDDCGSTNDIMGTQFICPRW